MIKVLFVCLGNICRSPMAEAMFRDVVMKKKLEEQILVDSAGTGNWHIGQTPHKGTIEILEKYNISTKGLKARQIHARDIEEFEYIIAMDSNNKKDIEKLKAVFPKAKIKMLLDFVPDTENKDVPDPYFTGDFEEVYNLVKQGCEGLLEHIMANDLHDVGGKINGEYE
ncbi:low molecular weight protein-tyrosine-phosphatase [Robertmurraya andreesenii]|uniref:protein-tyrosine-phosphatase n=1 Tax=Anoxybacillus andreesenii TaxID=1325932 RepID=A0ABT9V3P9_9BACL|nr:low molecular weight protein-tyrosine-phosphatase [Robertmurraya andreesenii]MDQ0155564.1 protein-tyrosine phosphatase [Robertmurraya andreesenii]